MICEAWEGLTVDGKFPLLERLDGGPDRCLFLTVRQGIHTAGIRVLVADTEVQNAYLARWEAVRSLSHPSLVQIMETGRSSIRDSDLVYVVTPKPEKFFSGIIRNKALYPARVKEILEPIVNALSFLHEKGLTYGNLKPANIASIGEHWKLASDEIAGAGESAKLTRDLDTYDAPEVETGNLTPAVDLWSLGLIVIEAFAQKTPMWDRGAKGNLGVPESLPQPFRNIARACLRWEPQERISIAEVKDMLARHAPFSEADPEKIRTEVRRVEPAAPDAVAPRPEATAGKRRIQRASGQERISAVSRAAPRITEVDEEEYDDEEEGFDELIPRSRPYATLEKERKGVGRLIVIGIIVLVIAAAGMALRGYWSEFWPSAGRLNTAQSNPQPSMQPTAPADDTASAKPSSPTTTAGQSGAQTQVPQAQGATPAETVPENQPASPAATVPVVPKSQVNAEQSHQDAQLAVTPPPSPAVQPQEAEPIRKERAPEARPANAKGTVAQRVLPNVAAGARESMGRPVEVELRVAVDERGRVFSTQCLTQSPGNYFAKISRQAAESWKFQPPLTNGKPRSSDWLIHFRFDRSHTEVSAMEMR